MEVGGWRVIGGGWRMEGGGWRVEGGGWRVEGGWCRVEGGGWRVEGGGRNEVETVCRLGCPPVGPHPLVPHVSVFQEVGTKGVERRPSSSPQPSVSGPESCALACKVSGAFSCWTAPTLPPSSLSRRGDGSSLVYKRLSLSSG